MSANSGNENRSGSGSTAIARRDSTQDSILDRRLPYDLEAEQGVIGSMILQPDCYDDLIGEIVAEDFFDKANEELFRQIAAMRDANRPVDTALLIVRLKEAGVYETVGGAVYIGRVSTSVCNYSHVVYYARIVREHSIRRRLIAAASETLRDAYDGNLGIADLISQADTRVATVSEQLLSGQNESTGHVTEMLHQAFDAIDARQSGHNDRIRTGVCGIDRIIGGLRKTQLVVIGARSSQGKSSLLLKIAHHFATRQTPLKVLFISLEMGLDDLGEKLLSMEARVDSLKMSGGRLTAFEREEIIRAGARLAPAQLWFRDPGTMTVSQIASLARTYSRRLGGLDVLCVDYVQLIQPESGPKNESRQQQIGKITRKLKQIAKDQNLIVITPAQVSRESDKAAREPRMSDLREAGDIEQDADVVIMCHMPGAEDNSKRPARTVDGEDAKLLIRKNRGGPTGETEMYFFRAFSLWADKADSEETVLQPPLHAAPSTPSGEDEYGQF